MGTLLPANRAAFSVDEVLAVTGGVLVRRGADCEAQGVCTDTRRLQAGNLFVALRGPTYDGHAFLKTAQESGVALCVVSQYVPVPGDCSVVRVHDTREALGALGHAHRLRWARQVRKAGRSPRVVALTGSAGKTTTARAVSALLQALHPGAVHSAVGNLNNQVGVPLVLLGLEPTHCLGVVEIGTNAPGEIAYGTRLAEPDIGLLTLVSCAHGEGLGTLEDIAREKGCLFEGTSPEGAVIVNADDGRARAQLLRSRAREVFTYGVSPAVDVQILGREAQGWDYQRVELRVAASNRTLDLRTPLLGEAGAYAVAAAVSVGLASEQGKVDLEAAARGLEQMKPEEGRLRPKQLASGLVVIDDAYNANPASLGASIRASAELAQKMGRPLVLVLGEMRELGMHSAQEHEHLGAVAAASGALRIVAVGGAARVLAEAAKERGVAAQFAEDSKAAVPLVLQGLTGKEILLVKGSRGVALEHVVEALEAAGGKGSA